MTGFYDKNGKALHIGDHIMPDAGLELEIASESYIQEIGENCLIGHQVQDPETFSLLTVENLQKQWTKKGDD